MLLSDFSKEIKKNAKVIDLGTGTGILPILLSKKTEAQKLYGVEIQEEVAQMAMRSVKLNNLQDKIEIINDDIKNLTKRFETNFFDVIVTNPPYKKLQTGKINDDQKKLISRHEITANLEDFINISKYLLKDKGSIYMVHKPERLVDIIYLMRKNNLEPKVIKMVQSSVEKEACLVLIKAVKNGGQFLKVEKPIYIYKDDGNYTDEILKIYNKI